MPFAWPFRNPPLPYTPQDTPYGAEPDRGYAVGGGAEDWGDEDMARDEEELLREIIERSLKET